MNTQEFVEKVRTMRHHQKQYFRTHSITSLQASKNAEKVVDELVDCYRRGGCWPKSLFD